MKRLRPLALAVLLLAALVAPAQAAPVTFTMSGLTVVDTNPYEFIYTIAALPSFTLDTVAGGYPVSWTGDLFSVARTSEFAGESDENGTITATFTFTAPPGFSAIDEGRLTADYRKNDLDQVELRWSGPLTLGFGDGGLVRIDLADVRFDVGSSAMVTGTFRLEAEPQEPVQPVPEPRSLMLVGVGLFALVGALRRRHAN